RVQHYVQAVQAYQKSVEIFPSDVHALIRMAQALEGLGLFKRAESIYLSALELDPNLGRAHAYYARHLAIVGRQEEAEERLKIAIERAYNDNVSHVLRGSPLDPQFDAPQ
ncbi:MAG: tetratricopeptide repeat protein, partial [Chthoniobacteraceae bacterium]